MFREGGSVTAGNSCPLNDGAAAVLLMSEEKANELGLKPRARVIASATSGNEPEYMGVAPIGAIKNVLERTGKTIKDIDVVELNEAFAAQVIPIMDECDIPLEKLNPHGGAIALGHPFGQTGARIMTTLLNDLETMDKHRPRDHVRGRRPGHGDDRRAPELGAKPAPGSRPGTTAYRSSRLSWGPARPGRTGGSPRAHRRRTSPAPIAPGRLRTSPARAHSARSSNRSRSPSPEPVAVGHRRDHARVAAHDLEQLALLEDELEVRAVGGLDTLLDCGPARAAARGRSRALSASWEISAVKTSSFESK